MTEGAHALPPVLPGLVVRRRLGHAGAAPWVARSDDGTWVVARPGRSPTGLPSHPSLLPVLAVVHDPSGEPWVVTPYRAGNGLDRRLQRVGRLDAATSRSCVCTVISALAVLHEAGLAHGDLGPARVLLGAGDEATVDATCAVPATPDARRSDLAALADLIDAMSGGTATGRLGAVAAQARAGATAAALADVVRPGSVERGRSRHARARRYSRAAMGVVGVVALVLAAGALGVRLAARPTSTGALESPAALVGTSSPSVATPAALPVDWVAEVAALDVVRGRAFAAADRALLAGVDAPGGVALRRDAEAVRRLRATGVVADGWSVRLLDVRPVHVTAGRAVLHVIDAMPAYVLRDLLGRVVERRPARGVRDWSMVLVRGADGWRVWSVSRA